MSAIEYVDLGFADIVRLSAKAVLFEFEDLDETLWIPMSVLSTPTAAKCVEGHSLEHVFVEDWWAEKQLGV